MNVRISSKDNQSLAQENAALRNEVNILKEQLALLQEQLPFSQVQKQPVLFHPETVKAVYSHP